MTFKGDRPCQTNQSVALWSRLCKNVSSAIVPPIGRGLVVKRFIEGDDRTQRTLFPASLDEYIDDENMVHVIDAFVDALDLGALGFSGVDPKSTGRPAYHPSVLLKIYVYGYLNRIASSRRLEKETQRNIEMMWLTGRLSPDFKTIATFRKENAKALRGVCREFVVLCRNLDLFSDALVAIDSSKFKAVNNRDRNFTVAKMKRRRARRALRAQFRQILAPSTLPPLSGSGLSRTFL